MFAPALALAGTAASAIIGGIGAYTSGQAGAASASYQSQVAKNNAIIAEQNAQFELQKGQVEAENQNYKTRGLVGQQKAAQGASGIDVNSGSALDVRKSAVELGHLDALTLLNNAGAKAAGFRAQGSNYTAEAGLDTMKASASKTAGTIGAFSSLISGASSFSDKWATYSQKGII